MDQALGTLYIYSMSDRQNEKEKMIVPTEASFFGLPASFFKELHQLGYYALFVHQVSYITTRPLQCEVQQRNFFKNLPVQQRNFLQYGSFGAGSAKDTFSWILASFGASFWLRLETPHFMHSKRIHMQASHPKASFLVFRLRFPRNVQDQFYIKPSR